MQILVFDTETSCLPPKSGVSILETTQWPYILQIAWILYDTEKNLIIDKCNNLIKIDSNIIIDPKSIEVHKITQEKLQQEGIDINTVLDKFNIILNWADIIVGHNLIFDKNMIQVEGIRNNRPINFIRSGISISQYCTMTNSVNLCKLPFRNKNNNYNYKSNYKYPKLSELIYFLFREENINFHDAFIDVMYTLRAYYKLQKNLDIFTIDLSLIKLLN
tara:strand:- start:416 stop:1069 length:654 start_codon:yes stop_codon:yes gene_type:complete